MEKLTFKVPDGTESIEQSLVDGCLVTKFIPKVEEFKDLYCYKGESNIDCYKKAYYICNGIKGEGYVGINFFDRIIENCNGFKKFNYTKITREEMQAELAKYGKYFDFEEKVLRNLRWRAKKGESYFWFDFNDEGTIEVSHEVFDAVDEHRHSIGNYHQTKEQCDEYARQMIEYSRWLIK
jgi:hypothetical protein